METPEFLIWALECICPIRGLQDGSDPERTERQLRAARALGEARCDGRVFEGLCIDPPLGFRIDEAVAIYGGVDAVEQACGDCPANAAARTSAGSLAGCFGIMPLSSDQRDLIAAMNERIDRLGLVTEYARLFSPTQPRWYGLWLDSPLNQDQLWFLARLLEGQREFDELVAGLHVAIETGLPLYARLYPRGRVEGSWWRLDSHCPRCRAPWHEARARQCECCGHAGHPAPDKKRHARGRRPYFPLARLLGEPAAAEFLVRYEAFREQRQSTGRGQNLLRGEPPDSLPAD
jgi:hypothetical protein